MIDIDDLYNTGEKVRLTTHREGEALKIGGLRGGSTGALLYGKTPVGQCARRAYLRFKGIDINDADEDRQLMFDAGLRNEDSWVACLEMGIKEQGLDLIIRREEEIGIAWQLSNGTRVTGRPDIALVNAHGIPQLGLELKLVCSLWTAKDLLSSCVPKLPHLLQAGHYLKQMSLGNYANNATITSFPAISALAGLPSQPNPALQWEIWYTSRTDFAISGEPWIRNIFAKAPAHYMQWREDKKSGSWYPLKVLPFKMGFRIMFSPQGQLLFQRIGTPQHPGSSEWERSVVTWSGIEQFFNVVSETDLSGELPPRPSNVSVLGEKASWSMCNPDYCPLAATCDKSEKNLTQWISEAKIVSRELADKLI